MELTVGDRIILLSILPERGTFLTMKVVHELRQALHFGEAELVEFGITIAGERCEWKADRAVEVPIGPVARGIIVDALKAIDAAEAITDREYSLYERFVEAEAAT